MVQRAVFTTGISVYGRSVRGTWRGAPLLGTLRLCGKASGDRAPLSIGGPAGEPGKALIYQILCDMDEGGSRGGESLSKEAL